MSSNTVRASASPHFARRLDHPYLLGCFPERIYCQESSVVYKKIGLTSIWVSTLWTRFTRAQGRAQRGCTRITFRSTLLKHENQKLQWQIDDARSQQLTRRDSRAKKHLPAGIIKEARPQ